MAETRWVFELDGGRHTVELEHNAFTKKGSVRVDGRLLHPLPGPGGRHVFNIGAHACEAAVRSIGRKFDYELLVDGEPQTAEVSSSVPVEIRNSRDVNSVRWAAVILFLVIGVFSIWLNWNWALTKGYYIGELNVIGPAVIVIAVYFILFPQDFVAQYSGKITPRMWVAIILALAAGFGYMVAFENGWFWFFY